jgi:hypothetical protein
MRTSFPVKYMEINILNINFLTNSKWNYKKVSKQNNIIKTTFILFFMF